MPWLSTGLRKILTALEITELDDIGRDIQVIIVGRYALYFWADHAVKEVKVIGMKATAL